MWNPVQVSVSIIAKVGSKEGPPRAPHRVQGEMKTSDVCFRAFIQSASMVAVIAGDVCSSAQPAYKHVCTQTSPAFTGNPQQLQTHFDTTRVFNDGRQVALIGCIVISGEIGSLIKCVDLQVAAGSA